MSAAACQRITVAAEDDVSEGDRGVYIIPNVTCSASIRRSRRQSAQRSFRPAERAIVTITSLASRPTNPSIVLHGGDHQCARSLVQWLRSRGRSIARLIDAMTGIVSFLFIGLIVVIIAKALVPGRDPGVGISLLIGTLAQVVVWFGSRLIGLDRYGQPWSLFLSIGAAVGLLHLYRDSGVDAALTQRRLAVVNPPGSEPPVRPPQPTRSVWALLALAAVWAALGAFMLGITGFLIGFFGPMRFQPGANQGPMLGLFFTGPAGVVLGAVVGAAVRIAGPNWPTQWRFWTLNAANVAWGLFVLDLVVDPRWR
jgi:hypothetical protein